MNFKSFMQSVFSRTLSVFLTLSLCLSWFPHTAFATEAPSSDFSAPETTIADPDFNSQTHSQGQAEPETPSETEEDQIDQSLSPESPDPEPEQPSEPPAPEADKNEPSEEEIAPEAGEGPSDPVPVIPDTGFILDEVFDLPAQAGSVPDTVVMPPVPEITAEPTQPNAISPYALDATPSTSNKKANFYINLDGSWTCIGTLDVTVSSSWFSYSSAVTTSSIVTLINDNLSDSHALTSSDFKLYHASNEAFSSNAGFSTIGSSSTTLGSYMFDSSTANSAKYVRVMSTASSTSNLTPLEFYTVILDYPDQEDETLIVPTGETVTMPEGYTWTTGDASYPGGESVTISETATFVASAGSLPSFTVTCINGENTTTNTVFGGNTFTLPALSTGYQWVSGGVSYTGGDGVVIQSDMIFTATPIAYTVTCISGDNTTTNTVNYGDTFTLPALSAGYQWTSSGTSYAGGEDVVITGDTTFTATPITYTVTCINGSSTTNSTVNYGESFTLPSLDESSRWLSNGVSYSGGETVQITGDTTFTAVTTTVNVTYDVNFPTGSTGFYGTSFPASPTLVGTESATTVTDAIVMNQTSGIRDVSSRTVTTTSSSHGAKFQLAIYFSGWETESGEVIEPNSILSWSDLLSYDADGDGVVDLEGSWSYGSGKVANFCVRYDSKTGQSDTSTTKYTPSLFSTYVGGSGSLSLDGATDEAAYQVDQQIRALYGNWGGDLWLSSFPSDEYIFEALKSYASSLTVNDKSVNVNDLNSEKYAIRWYMIKKDSSDGWHVDGRLFEKTGQITVDKEFYGDESAVAQAEDGFYIEAVAGMENAAGDFVAHDSDSGSFKQYILVLDDATASSLASTYPDATFQTYNISNSDPDDHAYEWLIEGVALDELWQITEYPVSVDGYKYYTEYSVYDTDGETTALAEYGTAASVVGKTFALDEDPDQGMLVDFRNYYYSVDSIFIKTEDGDTGLPIPGAGYELWQAVSDGTYKQLTFSYDADSDQYIYDSNGSVTQITSGSAGFAIISTAGFSYTLGDVVIKEILALSGYSAAPNITLTSVNGTVSISDLTFEDGASVSVSQWPKHAELEENGEILVVKNYSADPTTVTVEKVWADNVTADSVTVVLQANGSIASNAFPGMTGVQVTLNDANDWSYTWENLPSYANGAQVEWSVKETKIGDETTMADGVTYANWTVVYSPASKTDSDSDGNPENWSFTVTNTVRRTQLFLTKTDSSRSIPLSGAEFTLVAVEWSGGKWNQISGAAIQSGVSDANGLIHFDALATGAFYLLTETDAPSGFSIGQESIVLTLDNSGQVFLAENGSANSSVLAEDYHIYTAPYNISVTNISQYSCSISAPDSLVFTYEEGGYIWNPETMKYEQADGHWTLEHDSISVTNTTAFDGYVTVDAVFTFTSEGLTLSDYLALDSSKSSSVTKDSESITLTSTLASGEKMFFYVTLDENAPALSSGSTNIGSLSIRVRSPRRRLTRRLRTSTP